jgi:hypothetical protein
MEEMMGTKEPTVEDLTPTEEEYNEGVAKTTKRYSKMSAEDGAQILGFEIEGYVRSLEFKGVDPINTYKAINELLKHLAKIELNSRRE